MADEMTTAEAVTQIASESPEAAGLLAQIMQANADFNQSLLPTWDDVEKARREGFRDGWKDGYASARWEIQKRIFGVGNPDDDDI